MRQKRIRLPDMQDLYPAPPRKGKEEAKPPPIFPSRTPSTPYSSPLPSSGIRGIGKILRRFGSGRRDVLVSQAITEAFSTSATVVSIRRVRSVKPLNGDSASIIVSSFLGISSIIDSLLCLGTSISGAGVAWRHRALVRSSWSTWSS